MRARKKSWTFTEIETNPLIIKEPAAQKGNWRAFFQNDNPIHLEIGCGKGRFITESAKRYPDINFIALEREAHVIVTGARACNNLGLPAAFMIGDAEDLPEYFAPGEIARLYINFCDPWPNKKKWAKRRLTHSRFLNLYKTLLAEGGDIHFKTDNAILFEYSLNSFCENGWLLRNVSLNLHRAPCPDNMMTEYEEKFSALGFPIFRLEATAGSTGMEKEA